MNFEEFIKEPVRDETSDIAQTAKIIVITIIVTLRLFSIKNLAGDIGFTIFYSFYIFCHS
jgi:hypothetical protein